MGAQGLGITALALAQLLLLALSPCQADHGRGLRQLTSAFCEASSSVSLVITSGSGSARSNAFCKAETEAKNGIEKIVVDWVDVVKEDPTKGCMDIAASAIVEGYATAVAKAFTSVSTQVQIDGQGTACAAGFAQGDAFAVALVDITIEITIETIRERFGDVLSTKVKEAIDKGQNTVKGEAVGRALTAVISEVWATASDSVCTTGGFTQGFDDSQATQIRQASAFLFAEVVLTVCAELGVDLDNLKEYQESIGSSTSFISGQVAQTTIEDTSKGDASTGSTTPQECTGLANQVCCSASMKLQDSCPCGIGCSFEALGDFSLVPTAAKIWKNIGNGEVCFCQ